MKKAYRIGIYILFILFIYILVNDPFWIPTYGVLGRASRQHSVMLLTLLSIIFIVRNRYVFTLFLRKFKTEFLLISFLIIYGFLLGRSVTGLNASSHIDMLFQTFLIPIFLIYYAVKKLKFIDENSFVKTILIMSAIGGILSTICILNPSFDIYVKESVLQISEEDKLAGYTYRAFGVAKGLLFGYGISQGIALSLGIFYLSQNKWYYYFIPFVLASILFNARTGFFIPAFATIIHLFSTGRNRTSSILVTIFFIIFIIYYEGFITIFGNEKSVEWLGKFFDQVFTFTQSGGDINESSTLTHLFQSNLLPQYFEEWMLGTGFDIARTYGNSQSDIGFMRQLHYGGIFYCILLYSLIIYMVQRLWRYKYKKVAILFMITFLIANTKGLYIPISNGFILFSLLYYYLIYIKAQKVIKNTIYF